MFVTQFFSIGENFYSEQYQEILEQRAFKTHLSLKVEFEYLAARLALKNCLEEVGEKVISQRQLFLENYQKLPSFPDYFVSLSHTKGLSCAMIGNCNKFDSVGIDIEWINRKIDPNAERFFRNDQDDQSLSSLELWCSKEACYKALSGHLTRNESQNSEEKAPPLTLKNIWIHHHFFGLTQKGKKPSGIIQIKTIKVDQKTFIVAQAFILKNNR